jgi:teichuronic acid biosynthesis glycosyltransferase TuaG
MANKSNLVSIVVPVYNAGTFLEDTIQTVQAQTYPHWELLLVDDGSKDNSVEIIEKFLNDDRIKLIKMERNRGAALARNMGVEVASGRFLAYLDADDIWKKDKLEKQIAFMQENERAFSFTGYEFADANGTPNGKKVFVPAKMSYREALKNTTIWTSTVMFDLVRVDRELVKMPDIKSEDTATWWNVMRHGIDAYGINEILSYYRRTPGTLSSNKLVAIQRIWFLYRRHQNLNFFYALYCFCGYAVNATLRRV